jgi:2-oxo-4-hydroxy-4-carboxy-5-ureidoimidazoline decarboxylase
MKLEELNTLSEEDAFAELFKCCGSTNWANLLSAARPFRSIVQLLAASDKIWLSCTSEDALEAFSHHPKIGDLKNIEKTFAATSAWAGGEQAGVNHADKQTLMALAKGNEDYALRFGYIFIVCASGKTASEMLGLLQARIYNDKNAELEIARAEQNKITHLRIEKLLA